MSEAEKQLLRKMIEAALKEFPRVIARQRMRAKESDKRFKAFKPVAEALVRNGIESRHHQWRLCSPGHHWVREHLRKTQSGFTSVEGHCRINLGRKDELSADEIVQITKNVAIDKSWMPASDNLGFLLPKNFDGNQYDRSIAIWTKYWNDIFAPDILLDADFVKALMASESGFNPVPIGKNKKNPAYGLMQVTKQTLRILGDPKGELKNHLIHVDENTIAYPDVNIAAAIRWLHFKREKASKRLGRPATWQEALLEYKGYLKKKTPRAPGKPQEHKGMKVFRGFYERLQDARKQKIPRSI